MQPELKSKLYFFLLGALLLIVANSVLAYFQSFIFGERTDLELYWISFVFSVILFQWAFILVMIAYYAIREKINSNRRIINWAVGFVTCFIPYLFYCMAEEWDNNTIRVAILNCIVFGFVLDWLYKAMILQNHSRPTIAP